jgi:nicotinate phosphoribosyltransferase
MGHALDTDLYELNMAASYLRHGMNERATFSLFCRSLPADRGFLVAAGLEDCLSFLEAFSFDASDLAYLATIGFSEEVLEAFQAIRFTGEVWAVPEGTVVFANEPILEITAPIAEAQLLETFLLNQCTFQTTLATKAARCRVGAADRIDLVDFSLRRTQGIEAGFAMARLSAICGFVGTSNVQAARQLGLLPSGTMAHSYIEAFENEYQAFVTFAEDLPDRAVFLVDTFDSLTGVQHAIDAIVSLGLEERSGVRLDSGDLAELARQSRQMLDEAGLFRTRVFVSGGLDEHDLARFVAESVPIDAAGVGTRMGVSADAPYVDSVYKLVEYAGRSVMKLSAGKATLPGPKQVFRAARMRDMIACRNEATPPGFSPLLEQVMADGARTRPAATIAALRARVDDQLQMLPTAALELSSPTAPVAELSAALRALDEQVRRSARGHAPT